MKIMAPAGDRSRMDAAIQAGADEVYMGLVGYGARRFAGNFTPEEYIEAIREAHRFGVSVNLTLNTILSDTELDALYDSIAVIYQAGLDSVIVQDFGVARWLQKNFPDLPLHASTQMSLTHSEELNLLKKQGFNRAVLARELTLDEIAEIRSKTDLELEIFASGALCLSCSGKCCLSSFIGGRSGNRGMCTQPCRQLYRKINSSPDELRDGYFLSLKDQWHQRAEIKRLIDLGVDSIKLEGRMKSPFYVFEAVRYYRQLIDEINKSGRNSSLIRIVCKGLDDDTGSGEKSSDSNPALSTLRSGPGREMDRISPRIARLFNRGYDHGYFYQKDPAIVNPYFSSNFGVEIGRTAGRYVELSAPVHNGDGIVYLDRNFQKIDGHNVSWIDLVDGRSFRPKKVDFADKGQTVLFENDAPPDAVYVFKTSDYLLEKELTNRLKQTRRYSAIDADLTAQVGKPLRLKFTISPHSNFGKDLSVTLESEAPLAESRRVAADPDVLRESLDRLGDTPFFLKDCRIKADSNVFVPKSEINQLRQKAAAALEEKVKFARNRKLKSDRYHVAFTASTSKGENAGIRNQAPDPDQKTASFSESGDTSNLSQIRKQSFSAAVQTEAQFQACLRFGVPKIHYITTPVLFPSVQIGTTSGETISGKLSDPLAGSLFAAEQFEKQGITYSADWTFNIGNSESVLFLADLLPNMQTICFSPEISERACRDLAMSARRKLEDRPLRFALPVYGYLNGMFTRKTLFDDSRVDLISQDERPITVFNNRDLYPELKGMTGSSIRYGIPLDIIDAISWILEADIDEVRFDFTQESPEEVSEILDRAMNPQKSRYNLQSYGFGKGIF